jgi:glycosyltransferase involved in cell wall biosynthesis
MPLGHMRGGGELMLAHLVREGRQLGAEWHVVFLEPGPLAAEFAELGVNVTVLPAGRVRQLHRYAASVARIARWARANELDVVVGWMGKAQIYASPAAVLARVPALWYQLGTPTNPGAIDRLATLLPARGVMAVSEVSAEAQGRLFPSRRTRAVYPGVELEAFDPERLPSPEEARRRLGLPVDGPLVGIFGRLQRWKGMHVLVEAMPSVTATIADARAVIVGGVHALEPDYEPALRAQIERLGLDGRVVLAGFQEDVPTWMQAMDVIVHASDNEPFGIVIIEAMALGKPVIATDSGGPREILTDGENGLLVPFEDSDRLSAAVVRCLKSPDEASAMGQAARARARRFSTSAYVEDIVAAMRELVPELAH